MNTRFHVPTRVFGARRGRADRDEAGATPPVAPATLTGHDPVLIDPLTDGAPGRSCAYLLEGDGAAIIDPGAAGAAAPVIQALRERGTDVRLILLTHTHAHAAAGAGLIARHFPDAVIAAPAGACGQLADPDALVSRLRKAYGERAEQLFGLPAAIASARVRPVAEGDRIRLGSRELDVIAAPGHTTHHVAFLDRETGSLFCGDALGVQLPGSQVVRPSTPPWDFSLEDSLESIRKLAGLGSETVYLAHYGAGRPGPDEIFDRAADSLARWHRSYLSKREQAESDEDLSRQFNASLEASLEPVAPSVRRDLEHVVPASLNLAGLRAEQDRLAGHLRDAA